MLALFSVISLFFVSLSSGAIFYTQTKATQADLPSTQEKNDGWVQVEPLAMPAVPFVIQAPTADWSEPRFQDGCEEAATLMVMSYINRRKPTPQEAKEELLAITAWEEEKYGLSRDTSAQDTLDRLIRGYFKFEGGEVVELKSDQDLIDLLAKDNILIIPMDGQKLNNPYYSGDGPERHMLVVLAYDADLGEFITNDPGTKRGASYRYKKKHFFDSIRDYPTGSHVPIEGVKKSAIVIPY